MSQSRFIIADATVNSTEPRQGNNGPYWIIHFSFNEFGRNGAVFVKNSNIACFDAQVAQTIQVGGVYDFNGVIGVNQKGYLQMKFKSATPKSAGQPAAAPAQAPQQQYSPQPAAPAQQAAPQQAPAAAPQQFAQMPQAPQQAPAQAPAPAANGFDEDIPF